jgi:glucokinase
MSHIGIEIGGTKIQVVAGTADGFILERHRLAADRARGGAGIREQIAAVIPGLMARHAITSVGVGFGGPVDPKTGLICCSHQVPGWHDVALGDWLRDLTGIPVAVENDANVAALGEALRGAGRGFACVFWINMGSGVGGGMVVDGRLYHGARPGEAEIGHLRLDRSGRIVEQACSGWAVDQRIRDAVVGHDGVLARAVKSQATEGGEARHLRGALDAGDAVAWKILTEVADDLAFALSHAVHLFHPEVIVVGGGLSLVGEPLRAAMAAALPGYLMEAFQPGPTVALAGLGEDSVPIGALALAAALMDR